MNETESKVRIARPVHAGEGAHEFQVVLTPTNQVDPVILHVEPMSVLPVIMVPGTMGTNLRDVEDPTHKVWRLDADKLPFLDAAPLRLAFGKATQSPGQRQKDLHPDRTVVDSGGAVPDQLVGTIRRKEDYVERGWGEVSEASYHAFMCELEDVLNHHRVAGVPFTGRDAASVGERFAALMKATTAPDSPDTPWRPLKPYEALDDKAVAHMDDWLLPVYACGYNWLQDNTVSASRLAQRIDEIIERHHDGKLSFCKQVILVTHSMGGLVARACAKLPGLESKIAGVVHGVMPANGAAVAYRRCKVGLLDESLPVSLVVGWSGRHVTAVFAQSPGALELLPNQHYRTGWLEVTINNDPLQAALPLRDPYDEIYGRRDRWWGLIREEWLSPRDGVRLTWEQYRRYLKQAQRFHLEVGPNDYHPNTYAFYGADDHGSTASFEKIVWTLSNAKRESGPPQDYLNARKQNFPANVAEAGSDAVSTHGVWPSTVAGYQREDVGAHFENYKWKKYELRVGSTNGSGDGTVPASSGSAPAACPKVRQVFRLTGLLHEPAYRHPTARQVTLYSVIKIAAQASWPQPFYRGHAD